MIHGADAAGKADEECGDGVANPYANPCLPPGQANLEGRGGNHPRVDVEGICYPKGHEVAVAPLSSLRFDGFEIMIGEEKLLAGEARLAFHLLGM